MACAGCKKNRAKRGANVYLECPVCETTLHGRKKDMPKINDHLVCGQCYKKYKKMKELEKSKPKQSSKAVDNAQS